MRTSDAAPASDDSGLLLLAKGLRMIHPRSVAPALDEVEVRLGRGASLAVVGSSGSGKTTLLGILAGLLEPTAGTVRFRGTSYSGLGERSLARLRLEAMGIIFQEPALVAGLSVLENVRLPFRLQGRLAGTRPVALAWLERLGVASLADRRPRDLSRGEMQRVAVARALVAEPDLVLADEPTAHLDGASRDRVLEALAEVVAAGRSYILTTHDPLVAARAGARLELADGRVVRA